MLYRGRLAWTSKIEDARPAPALFPEVLNQDVYEDEHERRRETHRVEQMIKAQNSKFVD